MGNRLRVAVLISGGGTTLRNLIEHSVSGQLDAELALVISSNASASGNTYATENNIPLVVVTRKSFESTAAFSAAIFAELRRQQIELVVMGGFLKRIEIPEDFENRTINIHPSLIPSFCGQGFYGLRVHEAVVDFGCKISGCTVHFVDNEYDHGPIIAQQTVPVDQRDTAESLQRRVFKVECMLYPDVINWIAAGKVHVENRQVTVG